MPTTTRAALAALAVLCALAACKDRKTAAAPPAPVPATKPAPAPTPAPDGPASAARRTTNGGIAITNLDASINAAEHAAELAPDEPLHLMPVISNHAARAQVLGRVADLERALEAAEQYVAARPKDPQGLLARAGARAALHRFADAQADVDAAATLGAAPFELDKARAGLSEALGRTDEALALRKQLAEKVPGLDTLGALAALEGLLGDTAAAHADFARALDAYRDVSPIPVAWLEFQEGLMWERAGDLDQARRYYESAVARLPTYAAAVGHLAGVEAQTGNPARAIELLTPLVAASDDPEYAGQLAPLLRAAGRTADADTMLVGARGAYDELVARHPEAYSDHAARFWLAAGADPAKAHRLATANLALRPTEAAFQLAIDAALAAADNNDACAVADRALAAPRQGKPLLAAVWRAYNACGRKNDADAVDNRLR